MPKVLNNGYVELIESFGHDQAVIRNARRCWRSESKGESSDRNLIRHLITAGHKSPFEATVLRLMLKLRSSLLANGFVTELHPIMRNHCATVLP